MLFRYKIRTCVYDSIDRTLHGVGVGYIVTIQYYKPNAKLFKWRHFNTRKLCCILNDIGHAEIHTATYSGLFNILKKYNDIGEIMFEYIKSILAQHKYEQYQNDLSGEIDNLVLTDGWKTIEIKENE